MINYGQINNFLVLVLQKFDEEKFKNDVTQIPFHICTIFIDVSDQFCAQKVLFTDIVNEHAPLKERVLIRMTIYLSCTLTRESRFKK